MQPARTIALLALGATLIAALATSASAQVTVAVRTDSNLLGGASVLRKFRSGFVSDGTGERIVFRGTVRDSDTSIQGIFRSNDTGSGSTIAERDGVAPNGGTFRNFLQPAINSTGDVAWFAFLSDGRRGIYRIIGGLPNVKRRVFETGNTAPITPGTFQFADFDAPELTETGAAVFWGRAQMGTTIKEGIFVCEGGDGDCVAGTGIDYALVATGDAIPGGGGRLVCEFDRAVRASGYGVAFRAQTRTNCNSLSEASVEGVFRIDFANADGLELVALTGGGTDLGGGVTYQRFRDAPTIEDNGLVAFTAQMSGGPVSEAIFLCDPAAGCPGGAAESIVDKAFVVPGEGDELRAFTSPQVADNGDVVFTAKPRDGTGRGPSIYVWRYAGGAVERIVTGDELGPMGTQFKRVGSHHTSPGGIVIFRATVTGASWRTGLFLVQ